MERNITLDYFKLILTFLIITVHSNIANENFGTWAIVNGFGRLGVPSFLVMNGYFIFSVLKDKRKFGRYIFHIILIYLVWSIIYIPNMLAAGESVLVNFLKGFYHLWYLVSLILAAVILYFVQKRKTRTLLITAFTLYFAGLLIQRIGLFGIETRIPVAFTRNFLFMGFPLLTIGYCIRRTRFYKNIQSRKLILLSGLLIACMCAEVYFMHRFYADTTVFAVPPRVNFYISSVFLCPLLVMAILKLGTYKPSDGYISKLASGMYFGHILIITLVRVIWGKSDLYNLPLIFFLSVILSAGIIIINKRLRFFL